MVALSLLSKTCDVVSFVKQNNKQINRVYNNLWFSQTIMWEFLSH